MSVNLVVIITIAALFSLLGFLFLFRVINRRRVLKKSLDLRLIQVRFPAPHEKKDPKEALHDIAKFSQFISVLGSRKVTCALETAVPSVGEKIFFYVSVPVKEVEFISRQIQGLWPEAQVEVVHDYTIFHSKGSTAAAFLRLKRGRSLPLRTFEEVSIDTFASIVSTFSKLAPSGEGLALQVLIKPAHKMAKKNVTNRLSKEKQGEKVDKDDPKSERIIDHETVKLLEKKIAKPLFSVNVRLIGTAQTRERSRELLAGLAGAFSQFTSPLHNEFEVESPRNLKSLVFQFCFRLFSSSYELFLNSDEIASIYHFPTSTTDIPRISWFRTREVEPPQELAKEGVLIGRTSFRGEARDVFITDEDRRRHLYIIGQTGTGKSNLITNMATSDIARGKGVAVIDPHGDLIDSILGSIPASRVDDVLLFDPGDIERPLGLNMLEYAPSRPQEKTFIVNEMMGIFDKLFDLKTTGGPQFEQYTRNALLLLMDDPADQATLMEIPRVFTDPEFRKRLVAKAKNPIVVDFWEKEAAKTSGDASLANMTPYITSKFNNFIANDYVRPIIGQPRSSFNFRKIMDEGKILLVNLSKGKIGDINAGLLGMVTVGKLLMAALSRVDIEDQNQRRDFNLYIDEFQNFTTDSIATILSEARKYRLNLVIAHQFIAQLPEKIRDAVFGNVGSQIVFRIGVDDAEFIEKQFAPIFTKSDLINVDNFNAFVKLLIAGQTTRPFNIKTIASKAPRRELASKLKELSRLTYGADRTAVESNIVSRLRT